MPGREAETRALGKAYALFAVAFGILVVIIAVVARLGLDEGVIAFLVIAFTLATYAIIGIASRTLSLADFYLTARNIPAGFNGLATAAAFLSAGGFLGLAGAYFAGGVAALAVVAGWAGGFVLLAVLIAPYYRKSGAVTLPDFLAVRYGNPLVRLVAVAALIVSTFVLLPASIAVAIQIVEWSLYLGPPTSAVVVIVVLLLSSLPGGMRAVTFVAGAQAILILFGMLAPASLLSALRFGLPLPQFTYGYAVADAAKSGADGIVAFAGALSPVAAFDPLTLIAVAVSLAAGVASLPHVVSRSGTTWGVAGARRSIGWTVVIIAAVALTAPAIAAFARAGIAESVVGTPLDELPDWFFAYGRDGLIQVCGAAAASPAAIGMACGAATVVNGLQPAQIAMSADAVALAFADITELPYVMTALAAAGALAAALATASAVLMSVTATLGHDLYARFLVRRATAGRRLIFSRMILIAVALAAAGLAVAHPDAMLSLALLVPGLAAASFFPAVVLGIWWNRTTWPAALSGMLAGLATATAYLALVGVSPGGGTGLVPTATAGAVGGILGLVAGFAATIGVSFLGKPASEARAEVIDALRRPGHDPILEDHAA